MLSRSNYETKLMRNDSQNVPVTAVLFDDRIGIEAPDGVNWLQLPDCEYEKASNG